VTVLEKEFDLWKEAEKRAWEMLENGLRQFDVPSLIPLVQEWGLILVSREEARARLGRYGK